MLSLDRKKERERVRTRDESSLNHYLSTIIWSGDETCLIISTDIPASCFDIMFRFLSCFCRTGPNHMLDR